ncbi:MAG: hypothetical protein ACXW13_00680 [Burkholderiaceae bacterium]
MNALIVDKGWLSGAAGAFVQINSITGLRVSACQPLTAGFNVDALVEGNWVTIANFDAQELAMDRVTSVLSELKTLYRYGN